MHRDDPIIIVIIYRNAKIVTPWQQVQVAVRFSVDISYIPINTVNLACEINEEINALIVVYLLVKLAYPPAVDKRKLDVFIVYVIICFSYIRANVLYHILAVLVFNGQYFGENRFDLIVREARFLKIVIRAVNELEIGEEHRVAKRAFLFAVHDLPIMMLDFSYGISAAVLTGRGSSAISCWHIVYYVVPFRLCANQRGLICGEIGLVNMLVALGSIGCYKHLPVRRPALPGEIVVMTVSV